MTELSGLPLPRINFATRYIPKSDFLKSDLPCRPGAPGALDLRLLPGDLGDPAGVMKPVKSTLHRLEEQDELPYADSHVFLAGHAMGKTKAIFDLAASRFVVLLDASGDLQGQEDISNLFSDINHLIGDKDKFNVLLYSEHNLCLHVTNCIFF
jgi:hypothetical protein